MKKINLFGILITISILILPIVNAHQQTNDAGITPDSFLWGLDKAIDQLSLLLTFDKGEKAKKGIEIARERLLEVKEMIEENKLKAAEKAKNDHIKILSKVKKSISEIKEKNATKEIEEEIEIEKEVEEHEDEVEEVSESLKIKIEVKGALNEQQKALIDSILSTLENKTGEVKIEIKIKKDKTKIKIKAETGKSDKEIKDEIEDIEEDKNLTAIKKEKAAEEIEDAKEDLEELEEELQEGNFTNINAVITLIGNAKEKLSKAEEAFKANDFGEAFGQANAAEHLIENAERILEKSIEEKFEEEEKDEEEREIKVEIEDGKAEVKIKINDEKLKFTLETTNRNEIIQEIATRTGLSVDEINKLIEFEEEEKIEKGDKIIVTVSELVNNPSNFINKIVQVTGKLMNIGQSYFNPSFVISDGKNNFRVTSWLPLEVPPPSSGSSGKQPPTMSDYLDKTVTLQGSVEKDEQGFYLDVKKGQKEDKNICKIGGCSGQLCGEASLIDEIITTCEYKPEYECYKKYGKCEVQANGQCGWTQTKELSECVVKSEKENDSD